MEEKLVVKYIVKALSENLDLKVRLEALEAVLNKHNPSLAEDYQREYLRHVTGAAHTTNRQSLEGVRERLSEEYGRD